MMPYHAWVVQKKEGNRGWTAVVVSMGAMVRPHVVSRGYRGGYDRADSYWAYALEANAGMMYDEHGQQRRGVARVDGLYRCPVHHRLKQLSFEGRAHRSESTQQGEHDATPRCPCGGDWRQ